MHTFRKFKQFPKDDERRTKSFSTAVPLPGDDSFFCISFLSTLVNQHFYWFKENCSLPTVLYFASVATERRLWRSLQTNMSSVSTSFWMAVFYFHGKIPFSVHVCSFPVSLLLQSPGCISLAYLHVRYFHGVSWKWKPSDEERVSFESGSGCQSALQKGASNLHFYWWYKRESVSLHSY